MKQLQRYDILYLHNRQGRENSHRGIFRQCETFQWGQKTDHVCLQQWCTADLSVQYFVHLKEQILPINNSKYKIIEMYKNYETDSISFLTFASDNARAFERVSIHWSNPWGSMKWRVLLKELSDPFPKHFSLTIKRSIVKLLLQ